MAMAPRQEKKNAGQEQRLGEVIVFCTLSLLGGGLFALVAFTDIDLFYPALYYIVLAYIGWDRYFSR